MNLSLLSVLASIIYLSQRANGQLAAVFSKVDQTSQCKTWSSWGSCVWPTPVTRNTVKHFGSQTNSYLDQLSKDCQNHWFYKFIRQKWGIALNNFFRYIKQVTKETEPCGMCSYRQSCGAKGSKQCHKPPWAVGRKTTPFMVSEQVCSRRNGLKRDQTDSCHVSAKIVKRNKGTCTLWPSKIPSLVGKQKGYIHPNVAKIIYRLKWAMCIPEYKYVTRTKNGRRRRSKTNTILSCRCCCYPYRPNPKTFICEQIPGKPTAPRM